MIPAAHCTVVVGYGILTSAAADSFLPASIIGVPSCPLLCLCGGGTQAQWQQPASQADVTQRQARAPGTHNA